MDRKDLKLDEARYFFKRMEKESQAPHNFHFELSAFLSAARSVIQYVYDEAKAKNILRWYEGSIKGYPWIGFFKDKRDLNIHSEPVATELSIDVYLANMVSLSDSVSIELQKVEGTTERYHQGEPLPPPAPEQEETIVFQHVFNDLPGQDALVLCREYLSEIQRFLKSGREQGVIDQANKSLKSTNPAQGFGEL